MKIIVKASNLKLTSSIRNYVEEKIGSLEKFIQKVNLKSSLSKKEKPTIETWVEIGKISRHHHKGKIFRAECQMKFPGKSIRVESTKEDLHLAIDEIKDKLQREVKEYTEVRVSRGRVALRRIKKIMRLSSLTKFRKNKE